MGVSTCDARHWRTSTLLDQVSLTGGDKDTDESDTPQSGTVLLQQEYRHRDVRWRERKECDECSKPAESIPCLAPRAGSVSLYHPRRTSPDAGEPGGMARSSSQSFLPLQGYVTPVGMAYAFRTERGFCATAKIGIHPHTPTHTLANHRRTYTHLRYTRELNSPRCSSDFPHCSSSPAERYIELPSNSVPSATVHHPFVRNAMRLAITSDQSARPFHVAYRFRACTARNRGLTAIFERKTNFPALDCLESKLAQKRATSRRPR